MKEMEMAKICLRGYGGVFSGFGGHLQMGGVFEVL